ncbi:MAG: fumarate reductase (quinol) flavoprotein subunit [Chloroflexota bacterium]|jgi:fumarate reductase flavoprotein subunit|nr:fumarate reductase (quinol) flavoprotein subunit [Chloroflexota bacterium]MDP6757267.1 fumarate reductase (quinol) flavoprotein subunit [Chloroflexota bacterium]
MALHQHDIVIIGGGGAGLRAAIAAAEVDPDLDVAVVSKVYPMRSHTVAAEGGMAGVVKDNDSFENHIYDTISGSDWLADQDAVEEFVKEAPGELIQLEHWGCPWSREPDGRISVRPFGGMQIERTWYAADKTGFHVLHSLFQTSLKYNNITRYDEWFAAELLVGDGRCQGVVAIEQRTGEVHGIVGGATIMCTGGGGQVFKFTTNASIKTGDGMALAYRAGVALKDMEFVQYHPTGLLGSGILITEATRGEGGVLLNKDGQRYLQDHDLGEPLDVTDPEHPQTRTMELGPRDRLSQAFIREEEAGNVLVGPQGSYVHLDIRHLGEEVIDTRLPFVRELARNYAGVDPVHEMIPVRPVVHYMMGGIDTGIDAATSLPGLYAAGECACVSINGANRLGSNSLTELLVFGLRAGHNAAGFALKHEISDKGALEAQVVTVKKRIASFMDKGHGGDERIAVLKNEMAETMEEGVGIFRQEGSMRRTCDRLGELRARFENVKLDDTVLRHNTELRAALELDFLLDVAQSVAFSAIARQESRGSHQRTDFPARNDERYLKHSLAYRTDGEPQIEYGDVTITRWPPADRVYGN